MHTASTQDETTPRYIVVPMLTAPRSLIAGNPRSNDHVYRAALEDLHKEEQRWVSVAIACILYGQGDLLGQPRCLRQHKPSMPAVFCRHR